MLGMSPPSTAYYLVRALLVETERIDIDSERAEGDAGLLVQGWSVLGDGFMLSTVVGSCIDVGFSVRR